MQLSEFVKGCLEHHYNAMVRSVEGLSEGELAWMPTPECSSIGFLVWHYGRTLDRWVHSRLRGRPAAVGAGLGRAAGAAGYCRRRHWLRLWPGTVGGLHDSRCCGPARLCRRGPDGSQSVPDLDWRRGIGWHRSHKPAGRHNDTGQHVPAVAVGIQSARRADRLSAWHAAGSGEPSIQRRPAGGPGGSGGG